MAYQNIYINKRQEIVYLWDDERGKLEFPLDIFRVAYKRDPDGEFTSLYGDKLKEVSYYEDNDPSLFESDVLPEVKVLTQLYEDTDDPSTGHRVGVIDIEVDSTGGFPNVEIGDKTITAIAVYDQANEEFISFVLDPEKRIKSRCEKTNLLDKSKKECNWIIRSFTSERRLLKDFLDSWDEWKFSIVTGWNSSGIPNQPGFDLPYLVRRIQGVLSKKEARRLSPVRSAYVNKFSKMAVLGGVSCLDYLHLYKKFRGEEQPSYSLGNIGQTELGVGKVQYRGSLVTLYNEDLQKYIEYNLTDVKIVAALDTKFDFINLARAITHKGHVPYEWFMYSSRWIDGAILTHLHRNKLIAPNKPQGGREEYEKMKKEGEEGFTGAFVKNPIPGLYDWIFAADITSLYPSVIMSLNISPETKVGLIENWDPMAFLRGEIPNVVINGQSYSKEEFSEMIKDGKMSVAGNGCLYKMDNPGIVPTILDNWFKERVEYRRLAKEYKEKGDKEKESFYDRRQLRQKIFLNSVYGTLGLSVFRFYDRDNAEATTLSGQYIIKSTEKFVNSFYNERVNKQSIPENNKDYVIYIDTDSNYMSSKPLAEMEGIPPEGMLDYTINLSTKMAASINEFYDYLVPNMFNINIHRIRITPDTIASAGLWVTKKRYALMEVYNMEKQSPIKDGDRDGKLKVKGIDVVRSSFPAKFRKFSSELLDSILRKESKNTINERILSIEKEVEVLPISDISKNTSVTYVSRKGDANYNPPNRKLFTIPTLKTPPQVGSALMYNDLLKKLGLDKSVELIHSGQKIKWIYLKENHYNLKYLALKADGTDPDEILNIIEQYADRKAMYDKEFKTKIKKLYDVLGWEYPSITTKIADSFFE